MMPLLDSCNIIKRLIIKRQTYLGVSRSFSLVDFERSSGCSPDSFILFWSLATSLSLWQLPRLLLQLLSLRLECRSVSVSFPSPPSSPDDRKRLRRPSSDAKLDEATELRSSVTSMSDSSEPSCSDGWRCRGVEVAAGVRQPAITDG